MSRWTIEQRRGLADDIERLLLDPEGAGRLVSKEKVRVFFDTQ